MTSAELLLAAAERLRNATSPLMAGHRGLVPWHTEQCANIHHEDVQECACIVAQGDSGRLRTMYIASAETPALASYIALMHPGVGVALADWLEDTAKEMAVVEGTEYEYEYEQGIVVARLILAEPGSDGEGEVTVSDGCTCGRLAVGMTVTQARVWHRDCPEHGVDSVWWNSEEQRTEREARRQRMIELQERARRARSEGKGK